jgi:hypothetical protein
MKNELNRVEWQEGPNLVIGEWTGRRWKFWERDSWEVRWYPGSSTRTRIALADELSGRSKRRRK